MDENLIKKLKTFIKENPLLNKEGKHIGWDKSEWEENLNKEIPNWRELLKRKELWKEIKGIKPKRDYGNLLKVILEYAPLKILKEYLTSENLEERRIAYRILVEDNAKRLTSDFWKLLDNDTKIWLISKISEDVKEHYPRFLKELNILIHAPEYFFEEMRRRRYLPWIYPYVIPLAFTEIVFNEYLNILPPLWIKLKATVEEANDLSSMKRIDEIENKFKERIQRIIEKLKALFPIFQYHYPFVSKNVLFDPSLLMDYEKARKAFNFMKEHWKEFNFFIPLSFYEVLKKGNSWYKVARFFEYKREISPQEILRMLEKYKQYYTLFEIPREIYQEKYRYFYKSLYKEIEDQDLLDIFFEEWVFLQEFSWIVAKSKKVFEEFKKGGAITIEFSEKAIDKVIRNTLKMEDSEFINTFDKLRALGKWIAVGGASATPFVNPAAQSLVLFGTGIFLLLDP